MMDETVAVDEIFHLSMRIYEARRDEFASEHHGETVVIHGEDYVRFYDDELTAYIESVELFEKGSFILKKCIFPHEERPVILRSRAR